MKYLSLFSGIGGFEKGIENANTGWECVGFAEIDKYAKSIYSYHYPNHTDYDDVSKINVSELPDFNLLVGGFPCHAFSIAGKRQGFKDTRGTLFFEIARICETKRPEWILLENVKGLLNHESGKTITTIYEVLTELGYSVGWEVVNSCHLGVPQNRERIFIVGHLRTAGGRAGEILPFREDGELSATKNKSKQRLSQAELSTTIRDGISSKADGTCVVTKIDKEGNPKNNQKIAACLTGGGNSGGNHSDMDLLLTQSNPKILAHYGHKDKAPVEMDISPILKAQSHGHEPMVKAVLTPDRLEKCQNGRRFKDNEEPSFTLTSQDKHGVQVGTEIRRLTPKECERLQGFPDDWTKFGIIDGETTEISDTQRYKTLGNAVTVNAITAIASRIWQECK